jgi:hypothetical protein
VRQKNNKNICLIDNEKKQNKKNKKKKKNGVEFIFLPLVFEGKKSDNKCTLYTVLLNTTFLTEKNWKHKIIFQNESKVI